MKKRPCGRFFSSGARLFRGLALIQPAFARFAYTLVAHVEDVVAILRRNPRLHGGATRDRGGKADSGSEGKQGFFNGNHFFAFKIGQR